MKKQTATVYRDGIIVRSHNRKFVARKMECGDVAINIKSTLKTPSSQPIVGETQIVHRGKLIETRIRLTRVGAELLCQTLLNYLSEVDPIAEEYTHQVPQK